jgi:uncharacterized membrane protein YbhN (UPF0104 family)
VKSPDTKTKWINAFKLLLAAALVAALLFNTSLSQIAGVFRGISPGWLAVSALLFVFVNLSKAWQYHLLVQDKLPYSRVLNVTLIQNVVSNMLAAGAGIVSYFALFSAEHGIKPSRTLGMFLLVKMGDLIQIWLFLLASTWMVWDRVVVLQPVLILLLAVIAGGIGLFLAAIFLRQRFLAVFRSVLSALRLDRISFVTRLVDSLEALVGSDSRFVMTSMRRAVVGALVYLLVTLIWMYSITRALNFEIGVIPIIFVGMAQQLISYIPIQALGGLGMIDVSAVYLFSFFGYESSELIPIMLGWRILYYVMNAGLFIYLLIAGVWGGRKSVEGQA